MATDGLQASYKIGGPRTFTVSGTQGSRIVYIHAVLACEGQAAAYMWLDYAASAKARIEPLIGRMARSLHATQGCAS